MNTDRALDGKRNMRKIVAVTFDLWDTLVKEHPGGGEKVARIRTGSIRALLASKGILHTDREIQDAYSKTGNFLDMTWSKHRDMSVRDQILFMLSSIDDKLAGRISYSDLAELERIYAEGILKNPPALLPGAREALAAVSERGYKVGLISNTGRSPGTVLRVVMGNMGILDFFDKTTFSNEVLVRKPAEGVFRHTLESLRVFPSTAVHVGDSVESDVVGAKRVGMKAIQLITNGNAKSELADGYVTSMADLLETIERL